MSKENPTIMHRTILLLTLCVSLLPAQAKRVRVHSSATDLLSAPVVGYSISPDAREARVILGLPGSTHYSDPLAWPEGVTSVRPAAGHEWLLALRADGAASVWIPEAGVERALPLVTSAPNLLAFSPSGAAAALYWAADRRLVVYAGLPGAPELIAESLTGELWASLAVNDSGRLAVGLTETGELRTASELLRESRPVAAFGFVGAGDRLAVVDAASDTIELLEGAASRRLLTLPSAVSAQARIVPGGADWFLIADASRLHRVETSAESHVRTLPLPDVPIEGLQALRTRGAVLLEAPAGVAPRIVLSHSSGDDLFYLPTFGVPAPAVPEEVAVEEVQQ